MLDIKFKYIKIHVRFRIGPFFVYMVLPIYNQTNKQILLQEFYYYYYCMSKNIFTRKQFLIWKFKYKIFNIKPKHLVMCIQKTFCYVHSFEVFPPLIHKKIPNVKKMFYSGWPFVRTENGVITLYALLLSSMLWENQSQQLVILSLTVNRSFTVCQTNKAPNCVIQLNIDMYQCLLKTKINVCWELNTSKYENRYMSHHPPSGGT